MAAFSEARWMGNLSFPCLVGEEEGAKELVGTSQYQRTEVLYSDGILLLEVTTAR
jgi:hypothetical protein